LHVKKYSLSYLHLFIYRWWHKSD